MNLFKIYLTHIKNNIEKNKNLIQDLSIKDLDNINIEKPPEKFNFDLSSNAALILSKKINANPRELANKIKNLLLSEIDDFETIEIAGPGFLNIKLSDKILVIYIKIRKNMDRITLKRNIMLNLFPQTPQAPCT